MSTTKTAPEKGAAKDGEKPKSKKKLLVIVAAVLLVVAGVGGYLMFAGGSSKTPAAKPKPVAGAVVALDALTVNLAGGHYLKVKIALQLTATADAKTDGSKALDLAVAEFTDRPMADLSSADGRAKVKADLLAKVGKAYEE